MNLKKTNNNIFSLRNSRKAFAMLFTVIIVSLILVIGIGISNSTFKQGVLSNLAKDSQIAFYQADAGVECGMYYDRTKNTFPFGSTLAQIQSTHPSIQCGSTVLSLLAGSSGTNYFMYTMPSSGNPCFSVIVDKTQVDGATGYKLTNIQSRGNNICQSSTRQVERALQVQY
ncbi:MAG TPA: hypothetical protein VG982_00965 [Candidatus Paceibacterota bacterium]|nr:hypothetical protein [Candidatus Paceibacterota bacterium]